MKKQMLLAVVLLSVVGVHASQDNDLKIKITTDAVTSQNLDELENKVNEQFEPLTEFHYCNNGEVEIKEHMSLLNTALDTLKTDCEASKKTLCFNYSNLKLRVEKIEKYRERAMYTTGGLVALIALWAISQKAGLTNWLPVKLNAPVRWEPSNN